MRVRKRDRDRERKREKEIERERERQREKEKDKTGELNIFGQRFRDREKCGRGIRRDLFYRVTIPINKKVVIG